ncbi:MAG: hypothetical protein QM770_06960 [Tepidisphaeraceae bacterium]
MAEVVHWFGSRQLFAAAAFVMMGCTLTARQVGASAPALPVVSPATAPTTQRSLEAVLADLDSFAFPKPDPARANDKAASVEFSNALTAAIGRYADLTGELYALAPDHPKTRAAMADRWRALGQLGRGADLQSEIEHYFALPSPEAERENAAYWAAVVETLAISKTDEQRQAIPDRYLQRAPNGKRYPAVLSMAAGSIASLPIRTTLLKRLVEVARTRLWPRRPALNCIRSNRSASRSASPSKTSSPEMTRRSQHSKAK